MKETTHDGAINSKRIDLYKRNCFVLEAKQSRLSGDKKLADAPSLPGLESAPRGRRFYLATPPIAMPLFFKTIRACAIAGL